MADQDQNSVADLFRRWRGGDPEAGAEMAQRFSDWYYALCVTRLGEAQCRAPLKRACETFQKDIVTINSSSRLVDWAYSVVRAELASAGDRVAGGDHPNSLTRDRPPTALVQAAAQTLPHEQVVLLAHTFDESWPRSTLIEEAEQAGGFPLALLQARFALKRALRDSQGIPLQVLPDVIDPDLAPLPLYEAARLASPAEEAAFEQWMLNRYDLCRDVAEFSAFSLALRGNALKALAEAPPPAPEPPAPVEEPPVPEAPTPGLTPMARRAILAGMGLIILVLVIVLVIKLLG